MNQDDLRSRRPKAPAPVSGWQAKLARLGDLRPSELRPLADRWCISLAALKRQMRGLYQYCPSSARWEKLDRNF